MSHSMPPLVYVVILNYINFEDTIECVQSVENSRYPRLKIVIVDNGSKNGSDWVLRDAFPCHQVIQTGRNLGYAAGNNVGLRLALAEDATYVLILNNDTIAEPDVIDRLVADGQAHPNAGVLGPLVITESGRVDPSCARRRPRVGDYFWRVGPGRWMAPQNRWVRSHFYFGEYDFQSGREVDMVSGSCMLVRTELLRTVGLLDDRTFLYFEEAILHEKVRNAGYVTRIVPAARVTHKGGRSVRERSFRATFAFLGSLNYYLREYRGIGWMGRVLLIGGAATYRAPGALRALLPGKGSRVWNETR